MTFSIALLILISIVSNSASATEPRNIEYAGILWGLRQTAGPVDPGPTTFSNAADQVWIDDLGRQQAFLRFASRVYLWIHDALGGKSDLFCLRG